MERILPLPAAEAFALVADVRGHGRWIPLTRVQAPARALRPGDRVSALTAGVFRDRMVVTDAIPGRLLALRKAGPVLAGTTTIAVTPRGAQDSVVQWTYDAHLAGPLPRALTGPVVTAALELMAAVVLWRMERAARE